MTYFQRGQRQDFGNIFQIILTVCSHVKLQEFKATEETGLLFVRPAGPHGFIYIAPLGYDVGLRLKVQSPHQIGDSDIATDEGPSQILSHRLCLVFTKRKKKVFINLKVFVYTCHWCALSELVLPNKERGNIYFV